MWWKVNLFYRYWVCFKLFSIYIILIYVGVFAHKIRITDIWPDTILHFLCFSFFTTSWFEIKYKLNILHLSKTLCALRKLCQKKWKILEICKPRMNLVIWRFVPWMHLIMRRNTKWRLSKNTSEICWNKIEFEEVLKYKMD